MSVTFHHSVPARSAMAILVGAVIVACTPSGKAAGDGNSQAAARRASCSRDLWGSHSADTQTNKNRTAYADLNCDGTPDTITIVWAKEGGKSRPLITVAGSTARVSRVLEVDGLPEFAQFADVDGDGIRDILLATVDESTVFPAILLVKSEQLITPRDGAGVNWRELQYIWAEGEDPEACMKQVLPKMVMDSVGPTVIVSTSSPRSPSSCSRAATKKLRVKEGVLTVQ